LLAKRYKTSFESQTISKVKIVSTINQKSYFFADWSDEAVSSAEILRLIYQGRFLHGNVTLAALGLPTGKTTVMHLVPRESLPEPNSQGIIQFDSPVSEIKDNKLQ
jgi:hypothetical protein